MSTSQWTSPSCAVGDLQCASVCWSKSNKKWLAHIRLAGKTKHLGYFVDEKEAAVAKEAGTKDEGSRTMRPRPAQVGEERHAA